MVQGRFKEAEGKAVESLAMAAATAETIERIGGVMNKNGGPESLKLQLSERYIKKLDKLEDTRIVLPGNVADYNSWLDNLKLDELIDNKEPKTP